MGPDCFLHHLDPWSPTFLAPGTGFMEGTFSAAGVGVGGAGGWLRR